jgi:hypothetical protein
MYPPGYVVYIMLGGFSAMVEDASIEFATTRDDYEARRKTKRGIVYAAALHLPQDVAPLCAELRELTARAISVNVLFPLSSFKLLRQIRSSYAEKAKRVQSLHASCIEKLAEPTEGAAAIDLAWIQGITTAAGLSALSNLTSADSSVGEALDRKSAYVMACFSLYVSGISLIATVVLGVLSLR